MPKKCFPLDNEFIELFCGIIAPEMINHFDLKAHDFSLKIKLWFRFVDLAKVFKVMLAN